MSTARVEEQVLELADPLAAGMDAVVVAVEYRREAGGRILRVIIDRSGGVDLDLCQRFSRALSQALDEADPIADPYLLEVASPGLDRQLKTEREFRWFAGRTVRLTGRREIDGERVLTGRLLGLDEGGNLLLERGGGRLSIPLDAIARLRLHEESGKERGKRA